jgi:pimeloyl-ACP methyl ester carboxylesterase
MSVLVDRAFVRLAEGLVHYRHAGADRFGAEIPLYMAHAGPCSSRMLEPLVASLGATRRVIAPDMLGNGDSDPPSRPETDIAYYTNCVVRVLDALQIERIDFYGTHTGAIIGLELSASHPDRVRKLVLDGVMILDPSEREEMLREYAPAMVPDEHGGHLLWAHQFCRDMMLFYPYFKRDAEHWTGAGAPSPEFTHLMVVDVLKALTTYHCAYRAAFAYDVATGLAQARHPALLTCESWDPLRETLAHAAQLLPSAETMLHAPGATPEQIAARIGAFLDAGLGSPQAASGTADGS